MKSDNDKISEEQANELYAEILTQLMVRPLSDDTLEELELHLEDLRRVYSGIAEAPAGELIRNTMEDLTEAIACWRIHQKKIKAFKDN